jgi:hypothetical protein
MCQYIDTKVQSKGGGVQKGQWWLVTGVLVAVAAFGGAIQAGLLAPQFRLAGDEEVGGSQFTTIQNVSWRAWNITDVHFANGMSTALVAGHLVRLSLHEGPAPTDGRVGPGLTSLVVSPGKEFNLRLSNSSVVCHITLRRVQPGNIPSYVETHPPASVSVSAAVAVSTPFGTRDTDYQFGVSQC